MINRKQLLKELDAEEWRVLCDSHNRIHEVIVDYLMEHYTIQEKKEQTENE